MQGFSQQGALAINRQDSTAHIGMSGNAQNPSQSAQLQKDDRHTHTDEEGGSRPIYRISPLFELLPLSLYDCSTAQLSKNGSSKQNGKCGDEEKSEKVGKCNFLSFEVNSAL